MTRSALAQVKSAIAAQHARPASTAPDRPGSRAAAFTVVVDQLCAALAQVECFIVDAATSTPQQFDEINALEEHLAEALRIAQLHRDAHRAEDT